MPKNILNHLTWRFATKQYDPNRHVSDDDLKKIMEAIHLSPSSYGLQSYHVIVVKDQAIRQKLKEAGYNQPQFTEASHVLVFCARTDTASRIDSYEHMAAGGDMLKNSEPEKYAENIQKVSGYIQMMKGDLLDRDEVSQFVWAKNQIYIALGFALAQCAEMEIDSTPMEGFVPKEFDRILDLPSHLKSVVSLAIGYRASDPQFPKIRFDDLFTTI